MVPPEELTILEALVNIRNRLTRLKKDRTEYIRAKDVLDIYSSLMNEVNRLNDIRTPTTPRASTSSATPSTTISTTSTPDEPVEENRVDTILGDVFQLLSLFFLTIGKSRESPATFCQLATMKRLLTHLNESGIYTELDLKPFQGRLLELKEIITSGHSFADKSTRPFDSKDSGEAVEVREDREEGLTKLLLAKWDDCERLLNKLVHTLDRLSPELAPIHQRLITLRRLLASIASRPRPTSKDTINILTELRAIEDRRVNGKFVVEIPKAEVPNDTDNNEEDPKTPTLLSTNLSSLSLSPPTHPPFLPAPSSVTHAAFPPAISSIHIPSPSSTTPTTPNPTSVPSSVSTTPAVSDSEASEDSDGDADASPVKYYAPPLGQELLAGLLDFNFELSMEIQSREGAEDLAIGPLQPIYDRLSELRAQLERLILTHRFSLRVVDLYNYQMTLQEIDGMRKDGKWVDAEGNKPEGGQLVLLYLLRRCYGLCYRLMASSEPVSEELVPIANKLTTVKRCLIEVQKYGGPYSNKDLYPYQLALAQIDDLRVDGRFQGTDGSTPEGQAILTLLLSECFELVASMKEEGME